MDTPSFAVWFAARYLHLLSVGLLIGGAVLALSVCLGSPDMRAGTSAAVAYERIFWVVVGFVTVTGVSNLGLKGTGLLGVGTQWGRFLLFKLAAVLAVLFASSVRTLLVARLAASGPVDPRRQRAALSAMYAGTALALAAVMWVGLGLAHGRY